MPEKRLCPDFLTAWELQQATSTDDSPSANATVTDLDTTLQGLSKAYDELYAICCSTAHEPQALPFNLSSTEGVTTQPGAYIVTYIDQSIEFHNQKKVIIELQRKLNLPETCPSQLQVYQFEHDTDWLYIDQIPYKRGNTLEMPPEEKGDWITAAALEKIDQLNKLSMECAEQHSSFTTAPDVMAKRISPDMLYIIDCMRAVQCYVAEGGTSTSWAKHLTSTAEDWIQAFFVEWLSKNGEINILPERYSPEGVVKAMVKSLESGEYARIASTLSAAIEKAHDLNTTTGDEHFEEKDDEYDDAKKYSTKDTPPSTTADQLKEGITASLASFSSWWSSADDEKQSAGGGGSAAPSRDGTA